MLSNLRQELSFEAFTQSIGSADPMIMQRYDLWKGTPEEVMSGADYFTFDSTLQSEKGFIAQSLQELLVAVINNPMSAQMLDLDPRAMLQEVQYLRGGGNVEQIFVAETDGAGRESVADATTPSHRLNNHRKPRRNRCRPKNC